MRNILTLTILVLFCALDLSGQFNPCNWRYRKRIAFDPARVSGSNDLTDFPALITFAADANMETVANGGHVENANGFDIVFTASDGITQLSHDMTGYSPTTGSLTAWVKIPNLSTSITTYIYMYYGNAAIATSQTSSATWSNGYVSVWHFNNSLNNSTGTANMNGTNNGSTNSSTAKFNQARSFDGTNDFVEVTPYNASYDITGSVTVSGWVRLGATGADQKFLGNQTNANGGYKFGVFSDNKIEFEIRNSGNTPFLSRSASGGTQLAANTWYYVVGQYSDPANLIITYLNGNLDRSYTTNGVLAASPGTLKFGREPFASSAFLNGQLDEFRLSNVVRSADWVATEYENQNSPGTFYSISPEPKEWTGATNVNWGTGSNWSGGTIPAAGQDVTIINVVNDPVINVSPSIGALWIQNGGVLNCGAGTRTLSIMFDILNCGTMTGNAGHVQLNTTTIQVQHISGTGAYNLTHLRINNQFNVSPSTQLNKDVNVTGTLTLLSGIVGTSTTNILALGTTAVSTTGSSQSFISGPMSKAGSANFVFPVGKGQEWRPIRVSGITAATTFRAEYFTNPYSDASTVTSPLVDVSQVEFWQLDRTSGAGSANVSLYWENVGSSGIDDCTDLTIARWNGASWVEHPATPEPGSSCTGAGTGTIITNAVVSNFSPFTFGSKSSAVNALPVQLVSFSGHCESNNVIIQWSTSNERDSDHFVVERSYDGNSWQAAGQVPSRGENRQRTDYVFEDTEASGLIYYRLNQVDENGETEYSDILAVSCGKPLIPVVAPNPNSGEFTVEGLLPGSDIQVINASGQLVQRFSSTGTKEIVNLRDRGFYLLRVHVNGEQQVFKILVH